MKKLLQSTLFFLAPIFLSACVGLLNATIPGDGYTIEYNIAYGDNPKDKLDIYRPEKSAAESPVIFFIYGGRWETGSKDDYLFAGQAFASKGFTVVIADYRLYPEVRYPVFTEDSAKALVWTHQHIAQYGGNPNNIFVAGHSAGAYTALMLASNNTYIEKAGGKPSWIRGAIGLAGPYNFVPSQEDPDIQDIFSTGTDTNTQPFTYVHKGMPPIFLATGADDDTVKLHNTYDMEKKLKEMGDTVEVHTYPDVAHIGIVLSLARGFRDKAPTLDDIAAFVEKYGAKN